MATNSPTSPQTFQSLLWSRCRSCFRRRRNEGSMGSPIGGCSCSCDDPSFPAVDPAAQIRGVDRRGAVSGRVLLRPHASARETPASAALAAAASGAEVHPRPQELSPPRAGAGAGAVARPALGHKKTKRKPKLDAIKIASPRILTFRPGCAELLSRNFQNCLYLLVGALPFEIAWNRDEPIEPSFLTDLS